MKLTLLSLAALSAAFVIPDEQVIRDIAVENHREPKSFFDSLPSRDSLNDVKDRSKNLLDDALSAVTDAGSDLYSKASETAYNVEEWLQTSLTADVSSDLLDDDEGDDGDEGAEDRPRRRPHHPPHHGPHHGPHGKPNLTVYQLISQSKYTTKLAKLIDEDEELVEILNGTAANYTVFAPTDRAFDKIPEHAPKPSKEFIRKVLEYHVSPEFYPAGRVLVTHTIPTLLKEASLGKEPLPQRLSLGVGLKGLAVNFYSRVVAVNIFATNGVIHGVDSLIIPPPQTLKIINFLPSEFSTLTLGLERTGLSEKLNTTDHAGGTFFAPSNFAFRKLGPKINAFLFSKYGEKYLKALLEYHVVAGQTLYSDAFYKGAESETVIPKGLYHVDLPTLLDDRSLSVDVARYGPFITIKINGFARVTVQDGIAKDGVIQIVGDVLVPPKKLGAEDVYEGGEMDVEEFKERLEPLVKGEQLEL